MKKFIFLLISVIWVFSFNNCGKDEPKRGGATPTPTPSVVPEGKESKTLHIENNILLSGIRSLQISSKHNSGDDPTDRRLTTHWESDSWNNTDNKPILLILVNNLLHEIPNDKYTYLKDGNSSAISINCDITYKNESDEVMFYLYDKSIKCNNKEKTLPFNDQNGSELNPISDEGRKAFNFIFNTKTTVVELKKKSALLFAPIGSVILFDSNVFSGKTKTITIESDCFEFEGDIDLTKAIAKGSGVTSAKNYTLRRGTHDKSIYSIYCIGKNVMNGTIKISELNGKSTPIEKYIENVASFQGKRINLSELISPPDYRTLPINIDIHLYGFDMGSPKAPSTRSFDVFVDNISNDNRSYRTLGNTLASGTWDNSTNKPVLLLYMSDKVYEVPSDAFTYNGGDKPWLRLNYELKYKTPGENVLYYLLDKTVKYDKTNKTISFTDQNGTSLTQLNNGGKKNLNVIFSGKIPFTSLNSMTPPNNIYSKPCGTMILFDVNGLRSGENREITINSNYIDFEGKIDMTTGKNKNTIPGNISKRLRLNYTNTDNHIYGIYCIPRSLAKGNLEITGLDGSNTPKSYDMYMEDYIMGKYINLQSVINNDKVAKPKDSDWFITEWQGENKIKVHSIHPHNQFDGKVEYREKGAENWISYTPNREHPHINITGLDPSKTYELRVSSASEFKVTSGDSKKNNSLKKITQWGKTKWETMHSAFFLCENLDISANDIPDLSQCTDMASMFNGCSSLIGNNKFNEWDVSNVTNMESMFNGATNFNQPLDNWDVTKVTKMSGMFYKATKFNQPLNNWNVSNVTNMSVMFYDATNFNQPLDNWNVSNVTNMESMFNGATNFNQPLDNWDVSNVTNMESMFNGATNFNQPLDNWNVTNVTKMSGMFRKATKFNQPLNNWNVSNVTDMNVMFYQATNFDQPLNNWNVTNVTKMSGMFYKATKFNQPLNNWNVSNVTDMNAMFSEATNFNQPLDNWDVSKVKNMSSMFQKATNFNQPLNNWNVSKVSIMLYMFSEATKFNQPLNNWNVSNVTNMESMFFEATNFNQPLDNWDVSKVKNMNSMFRKATNFNQPLNNWNVSNVTDMGYMFFYAKNFNQPLNSWNVSKVTNMDNMFFYAKNFNQPLNNWDVRNVTNWSDIFLGCPISNDNKPEKFR